MVWPRIDQKSCLKAVAAPPHVESASWCRLGAGSTCHPGLLGQAFQGSWLRHTLASRRGASQGPVARLLCGREVRPMWPTLRALPPRRRRAASPSWWRTCWRETSCARAAGPEESRSQQPLHTAAHRSGRPLACSGRLWAREERPRRWDAEARLRRRSAAYTR